MIMSYRILALLLLLNTGAAYADKSSVLDLKAQVDDLNARHDFLQKTVNDNEEKTDKAREELRQSLTDQIEQLKHALEDIRQTTVTLKQTTAQQTQTLGQHAQSINELNANAVRFDKNLMIYWEPGGTCLNVGGNIFPGCDLGGGGGHQVFKLRTHPAFP